MSGVGLRVQGVGTSGFGGCATYDLRFRASGLGFFRVRKSRTWVHQFVSPMNLQVEPRGFGETLLVHGNLKP